MSAQMVSVADGVLTVRVGGQLKVSELQAMQKAAADAIEKSGKARVLCLADDFLGWEKSSGWGDVSFQARYDPFIEKIAIVGDRKWEDLTLLFTSKGIRRVPIEYFAPSDLAKARAWLAAAPESTQ
ncbi:MAG: STAS/SEC14 domain-containing protein [Verrucomicrobia subdivision 3 bacterium]|nr:STAS/SEC14 domain-containing protein [Limisphaerales bacterium]